MKVTAKLKPLNKYVHRKEKTEMMFVQASLQQRVTLVKILAPVVGLHVMNAVIYSSGKQQRYKQQ